MPDSNPYRLASFESYTDGDLAAFAQLKGPRRELKRGAALRHQGDASPDVYRLATGWLICSLSTAEGGRQITKIHLPGDLVGMPSLAASEGAETITALTDAVVEVVPLGDFSRVCREHPRFAMMLFRWSQEERIRLMHQLTLVGRMRSERRIAAFLLSIYDRLLLNNPETVTSVPLPLTQVDLGDATGMSVVQANRKIKAQRQRQLIEVKDGVMRILDGGALRRFAGTPPIPSRDTSWI